MLAVTLLLMFLAGTMCWSVALSGSLRPTLPATLGNGAIMTLLFLSLQPSPLVKAEIGLGAAEIPLMALVIIARPGRWSGRHG
jgi:hypothetical protein